MRTQGTLVGLFSLAFAASAFAAPPPNFSEQVYLCNYRLQAKVDIAFGQTSTTATVRVASGSVRSNPWIAGGVALPPNADYSVFVAASTRSNPSASWAIASTQQDGFVNALQPDISIGNSIFKSSTCEIKGTAIISTACPDASGMKRDYKVIERNWVGCSS